MHESTMPYKFPHPEVMFGLAGVLRDEFLSTISVLILSLESLGRYSVRHGSASALSNRALRARPIFNSSSEAIESTLRERFRRPVPSSK
jgi:hypothetical protein